MWVVGVRIVTTGTAIAHSEPLRRFWSQIIMRSMRHVTGKISAVLVCVASMAACTSASHNQSGKASSGTTAAAKGIVAGNFVAGQGPVGGHPGPLPGTVSVSRDGVAVATVRVGKTGAFRLALKPGTYSLSAVAPARLPCHAGPTPPQQVNVVKGTVNHVSLVCPVG